MALLMERQLAEAHVCAAERQLNRAQLMRRRQISDASVQSRMDKEFAALAEAFDADMYM